MCLVIQREAVYCSASLLLTHVRSRYGSFQDLQNFVYSRRVFLAVVPNKADTRPETVLFQLSRSRTFALRDSCSKWEEIKNILKLLRENHPNTIANIIMIAPSFPLRVII